MRTGLLLLLILLGPAYSGAVAAEPARTAGEERGTAGLTGSLPVTVDHEKNDGIITTPFGKINRNLSAPVNVRKDIINRGKAAEEGYEIVQTPFGPVKCGIRNEGKDRE